MQSGISKQLNTIRQQLSDNTSSHILRLAIAIYDPDSDELHSFAHSSGDDSPINHYRSKLAANPSLKKIAEAGIPRVINDLRQEKHAHSECNQRLLKAGFLSSYTVPIMQNEHLQGFIFFDADEKALFTNTLQSHLAIYSQLIAAILYNNIAPIRTLRGAIITAREFSHYRNQESRAHITRMSHYAHLVACEIAEKQNLEDEYCEYILQFAPLHDVGKIAIPDQLLLKPSCLTQEERKIVQTHVLKGVEIIDMMIREFELDSIEHISMLRNIIAYHHEQYNGNGYPYKLSTEDIPLEARIISVADVFDALTSKRPYKAAWSLGVAMEYIQAQAGKRFDPLCVNALRKQMPHIKSIHRRFQDEAF